ncbi:MAG: hypothetical protein Q9227_000780 [Pyrenula ochraceoflavens]
MTRSTAAQLPTTASLPHATHFPSPTRNLIKLLSKLSRANLIELALQWLEDKNQATCAPYLASNRAVREEEEEDYAYPPAENIQDLREIYARLKEENSPKRNIIDRILDGDWRRGLSLYQLATIDFRCLEAHDTPLRWSALKVVPLDGSDQRLPSKQKLYSPITQQYPSIHPHTFLQNLQREVAPVVKAHYSLHRLKSHRVTVVRLFVSDSPYIKSRPSLQSGLTDSSRTLFIAFPEGCPFVYLSLSGPLGFSSIKDSSSGSRAQDVVSLKKIVLEAVPKALSRPHHRYGLQDTSLSAKSLSSVYDLRGPGKHNASNGAFSIFTDGLADQSPLELKEQPYHDLESSDKEQQGGEDSNPNTMVTEPSTKRRRPLDERNNNIQTRGKDESKRRKLLAAQRFGASQAPALEVKGLDRLHIKLADPLVENLEKANASAARDNTSGTCPVTITFRGPNVFAGLRQLAEEGFINSQRMPPWMTGEEAVSQGAVKDGRMIGGMGAGA